MREVDGETVGVLSRALDDEFKARATYRKIIETFGPVWPFVHIVEAEDRHVRALLTQFQRLGVAPPADRWPARVAAPPTLAEGCEAAIRAEIDNAAMYEQLIAETRDPMVRNVMRRLQGASRERHLPAFRRCLSGAESIGQSCH